MSIYIFAPKIYPGTLELIEALQGKRLVKHDGMQFLQKGKPMRFDKADVIICWGQHVPPVDGVLMLNGNYRWTTQQEINIRMASIGNLSENVNAAIIAITRMQMSQYITDLEILRANGGIVSREPANYHVPCEDFPGFGSRYYAFTHQTKVTLFVGKEIVTSGASPNLVSISRGLLNLLQLDFGVISVGMLGAIHTIRKINTAPALNKDGVELFSKHITKWISERSEVKRAIKEMDGLL